ncbi:MAG: AAA family ATPase [Lachnospiraceae bacterium]|nr:AAA family ATPase [Lachnospiraceae bacterium]
MYKSEIRPSQIARLQEKVRKSGYNKYLLKVHLIRCRAFSGDLIHFDFPVTALIGPNGGGKTTILGAGALLYKSIAPRQFFARNRQLDKEMRDWSIAYEAIDREINRNDVVKRTAHFSTEKWSRDALNREVLVFGVSRTLPAVERSSLSRFTNKNVVFRSDEMTTLNGSAEYMSKILGKDVREYQIVQSDRYGNIQLLAGQTSDGDNYSEFHFGTGESSIIKMVLGIERAPENSLILIEEIENGLHPVAIMRLIDYLIDVADRKKLQIVYTTHSEYAIRSLPDEAVWAAVDGKAIQGKLDILSLRSLQGEVESELIIYTEDIFAKEWVMSMLRSDSEIATDAIEIFAMGCDGTAVTANAFHNADPSSKVGSICIIDGDSRQETNEQSKVFRLPGEAPEFVIFNEILDKLDECSGILSVRCMHKYADAELVKNVVLSIKNTNYDHHIIFAQIGEKLGFVNENVIRDAFLATWCEQYPDKVADMLNPISKYLPRIR